MKTYAHITSDGFVAGLGIIYMEGGGLTPGVAAVVEQLGEDEGIKAYGDRVKADATYTTIVVDTEDLPGDNPNGWDKTFRAAYKHDGSKVFECPVKSKEIVHDKRRALRDQEFAPLDDLIAKQIPGMKKAEAEAAREAIRAKYADLQVEIDACEDCAQLKAIIAREGL